MSAVAKIDRDFSDLSWHPMMPVEIALDRHPVKYICECYGVDVIAWNKLRNDPLFQEDVRRHREDLRKDGMSFKKKAQLQAEALLDVSWGIINNPSTPANVRADLIKNTIRVAGLDASKEQDAAAARANLQINIIMD